MSSPTNDIVNGKHFGSQGQWTHGRCHFVLTNLYNVDRLRPNTQLLRSFTQTILFDKLSCAQFLQLSDRIAVLNAGTIVESLRVSELNLARHEATLALFQALPVPPEVLLSYRDRSSAEESSLP